MNHKIELTFCCTVYKHTEYRRKLKCLEIWSYKDKKSLTIFTVKLLFRNNVLSAWSKVSIVSYTYKLYCNCKVAEMAAVRVWQKNNCHTVFDNYLSFYTTEFFTVVGALQSSILELELGIHPSLNCFWVNLTQTRCSHGLMQSVWNKCWHGRLRTTSSRWKSSMHTLHWLSLSVYKTIHPHCSHL